MSKQYRRTRPRRVFTWCIGIALVGMTAVVDAVDDKPKTEKGPLTATAVVPQGPLSVSQVNSSDFAVVFKLQNTSKREITVWPYLTVELLDRNGKPVKRTRNLGRHGFRKTNSILEGIKFVTLAPQKSYEIKVNLKQYMSDPRLIVGWQVPSPGQYQVQMHYQYDRKAVKKAFGKGCENIEEPDKPWNRAVELDKKLTVKLNVQK